MTIDPTSESTVVPVRNASTVMLVRPSDTRFEVLMLQRTTRAAFAGGMYVFPGGVLDAADGDSTLAPHISGRSLSDAAQQLGDAAEPLAWWVAALRESFEEAGLLVGAEHLDVEVVASWRTRLLAGDATFAEVLMALEVVLPLDRVHPVSRWVTPVGEKRRFDTRFFIAEVERNAVGAHDDGETIASVWVDPADALARHRAGDLAMILPTIKHLEMLARHQTLESVLDELATNPNAASQVVLPRVAVDDAGGIRVLLPTDEGYDAAGDDGANVELYGAR
jgi:8-oxo-dGTP pyrophosphatase MutT (NUDIX family)